MHRRFFGLALAALMVAACGAAQTPTTTPVPSPSDGAAVPASPEATPAATPSPSPTPTASPAPTPTPTPTATPAPTPKPTPTPWLAYKSKRFRYSVKYPPTWIVTPGSATRPDQFDDSVSRFVLIERDTLRSGTISISRTESNQIALFRSHYGTKVISRQSLKVAGWPARLITFKGKDDGRKLYIQLLLVGRGKAGYFITWFSDDGNRKADKALFKKIYKTFKPRS